MLRGSDAKVGVDACASLRRCSTGLDKFRTECDTRGVSIVRPDIGESGSSSAVSPTGSHFSMDRSMVDISYAFLLLAREPRPAREIKLSIGPGRLGLGDTELLASSARATVSAYGTVSARVISGTDDISFGLSRIGGGTLETRSGAA